eukprot:1144409-Pelagomonas_calceolata.AAC.18
MRPKLVPSSAYVARKILKKTLASFDSLPSQHNACRPPQTRGVASIPNTTGSPGLHALDANIHSILLRMQERKLSICPMGTRAAAFYSLRSHPGRRSARSHHQTQSSSAASSSVGPPWQWRHPLSLPSLCLKPSNEGREEKSARSTYFTNRIGGKILLSLTPNQEDN